MDIVLKNRIKSWKATLKNLESRAEIIKKQIKEAEYDLKKDSEVNNGSS